MNEDYKEHLRKAFDDPHEVDAYLDKALEEGPEAFQHALETVLELKPGIMN